MAAPYQPPYTLRPAHVSQVARIAEQLGRAEALEHKNLDPTLRRQNRIRSIQASLEIENNSLGIDEVGSIADGKIVDGIPREIREVQNAVASYEKFDAWSPTSINDLLKAHSTMMDGLAEDSGKFRSRGVGIYRGTQLVHMAPPADRVAHQVKSLLQWLKTTDLHPLLASAITHYELEFIHPFSDGNGRIGRLWQTLILSRWKPALAYLPVETVIRDQQQEYYDALSASDSRSDAAPFVEFILESLKRSLETTLSTDQVTDQATDQVKRLLSALTISPQSAESLMEALGLKHRPTFRANYLNPALEAGLIERTDPGSPRSPTQKYRLAS